MVEIRAYTDLSQSKILNEILPIESVDMYYECTENSEYKVNVGKNIAITYNLFSYRNGYIIPCWSFAALFNVLPNNEYINTIISRGSWKIDTVEYLPNVWWCQYEDTKTETEFNISADNPVDACVEMILKLNELNLL